MDDFPQELMATFRAEAAELLDELAQQIERTRAADEPERQEAILAAFRIAHNLKGSGAIVGNTAFEQLTHAMEDLFDPLRKSGEMPSEKVVSALLEAVTLAEHLAEGAELTAQTEQVIERLRRASGHRKRSAKARRPAPRKTEKRVPRKSAKMPRKPAKMPEAEPREGADEAPQPAATAAEQERHPSPEAGVETSIRVDTARLDHLMAYAGELLVTEARFRTRADRFDRFHDAFGEAMKRLPEKTWAVLGSLGRELDGIVETNHQELHELARLTDEIGSAMKRLRMRRLDAAAPVWRRIVRESAQECGKQVQLAIELGDVEIDRHILENLRDPLMHLLRNAVDHGIEAPAQRSAAGKPEGGTVRIKATMQGAMVHLEVGDDGRGLDGDQIAEAAVAKGLVSRRELARMPDEQKLRLLFAAGFSTAREVSRLSGRGVGLEVVRQGVEALGGGVEIVGRPDHLGTCVRLTLPVSLLSIRGLLVASGAAVCALPLDDVVRTVRVERDQMRQVDGAPVIVLDGSQLLHLRFLSTLMEEGGRPDSARLNVVVVSRAGARLGLVVDEILGEQEFVTKPLPWNLKNVPGVGGAVVLGDGTVAVVIDVAYLFESGAGAAERISGERASAGVRARPRVLVVDDSLTSRTLERNILARAGYEVLVAVDGEEAWKRLQESGVDLVVSDVQMPKVDGLELTRRIRADADMKNLPVVLVTALSGPQDLAEGAAAGADEYIVKKQFDQRTLLETVARLV